MSTHVLDNTELVTKQEVQTMIESQLERVDEFTIELENEKTAREAADTELQAKIDNEAASREAGDIDLQNNINTEQQLREAGDETTRNLIDTEKDERKLADITLNDTIRSLTDNEKAEREAADTELNDLVSANKKQIEEMKQWEHDDFPNASCSRIKNLPIALVTVSNHDKSLHVDDTIATVGNRFLPVAPVSFTMMTEQENPEEPQTFRTCLVALRIDVTGNINVVNIWDVAGATAATDEATVTYITKD